MSPNDVLFVAGNVERLASIRIRCREVAQRLGCQAYYNARNPEDVPRGYKAYICIKPDFGAAGVPALARKGPVVWDILDDSPPAEGVTTYIASTNAVKKNFCHLGDIRRIPHYHCNLEGVINPGTSRRAAYIGSEHWYPAMPGLDHDQYFVSDWSREEVADAYRGIGIALNQRNLGEVDDRFLQGGTIVRPIASAHVMLNSGIKLINCLGFGVPSVSAEEPAYFEIAPQCTLFASMENTAQAVNRLREDRDLYEEMRRECLAQAHYYHFDQVVDQYRNLIASL